MTGAPPENRPSRVRDIGEFGLIQRLQALIERRSAGQASVFELSIGDDAAVWQPSPGARQVVTTDALVEDVHFELSTTSWRDLGWKSLAVNVSDIAAMGARPRQALVTLGLRRDANVDDLLELYEGMLDLAGRHAVAVVGGDIVSSAVFFLNVTVIGEADGALLRRDGGRPGDLVAVTGALGASTGGLRLLQAGRRPTTETAPLFEAHLRPAPRVEEGQVMVEAGLRCAMDVSDGLLGDLTHICERSKLRAVLETDRVPIAPALAREFGAESAALAIGGGEDYELLCAGSPEAIERATLALSSLGTPLTVIGRLIEPGPGPLVTMLDQAGHPVEPVRLSWDHFRA